MVGSVSKLSANTNQSLWDRCTLLTKSPVTETVTGPYL